MSHEPPELLTPRLRLRAHRAGDLDAVHALWSDAEVLRHLGATPASRPDAWQRLLRYRGLWSLLGYGYWAVEERSTGAYVGDVGLAEFERGVEPALDCPEAGWVLARGAWGRGYATEALGAVLDWQDARAPGGRTCCIIEPSHAASLRVAAKCGYRFARTGRLGETELAVHERRASG